MKKKFMTESEIKIYRTEDGQTKIDVKFDNETVWLTQKQMAALFDKDSDTIGLHLKNIYQSGELEELSTAEESSVVRQEGKKLFDDGGKKRIADNTLVALTLMIAVSKPEDKDTVTKVIVNLINKNN
jgi:hypothetical protein